MLRWRNWRLKYEGVQNRALQLYPEASLTYRTLTLTLVVYLPPSYDPIKDIVLALAGLFELLFYLFLHFVLLVYRFLIHIIGFSKQICF